MEINASNGLIFWRRLLISHFFRWTDTIHSHVNRQENKGMDEWCQSRLELRKKVV